jgi:Flp pilus assembly protein TadG
MKQFGQRGNSMVEFALAATAFLLVLFGILEFARVLYIYHTVSNAARLASRWAMVRGSGCTVLDHCNATSSDIQTYVQSIVPIVDTTSTTASGCSSAGLCVIATWSTNTGPSASCDQSSPANYNSQGHIVCVTVKYPFAFAVPLVSSTGLTLSSSSQMVISN